MEQHKQQRQFMIGSKWLYYKIYCGPSIADKVITDIIQPLAQNLLEKQIIQKWFFIRYADTDAHIRVRFHIEDKNLLGSVIQYVFENLNPYLQEKLIFSIQTDMYSRELERYGADTIEEAENLFTLDSILVSQIIKEAGNSSNRWLLGMKMIDKTLNMWGINLQDKKNLFQELKTEFGKEFGINNSSNKHMRKQLSIKYRDNRKKIESIMNPLNTTPIDDISDQLAKDYKKTLSKILSKKDLNNLPLGFIESLIHMHCNRLFNSNQRLNEWVLYDSLYKYYDSALARHNKQIQAKETIINL